MRRTFAVWFYIGALLGLYGIMLTLAGIYQWVHPPATVLSRMHATFWAGAVLLAVGAFYTVVFWPRLHAPEAVDAHDGSRIE